METIIRPPSRPQSAPGTHATPSPVPTAGPQPRDPILDQLQEARNRWEREDGLGTDTIRHFKLHPEGRFTAGERATTTLLFGGLTWKHDRLIHGGLEGLGYKCEPLPVPDVRAFQIGKEFGNNGQCNPTYFTVGNLVKYLQDLEAGGMSRTEILDRYVFFTAGSCGPCRFGMYEAEYRLALHSSGFEGFRVLLFQQTAGLHQADVEDGLAMNLDFFMAILNAFCLGDLLNEIGYQIRPYEINAGETDRVLAETMEELHDVLRDAKPYRLPEGVARVANAVPGLAKRLAATGQFIQQLTGGRYVAALQRAHKRLDAIPVDRLRVKPIVKVTGEFWAQTTEGDGNFKMFSFLERENAQVLVEPVATWICYMLHGSMNKVRDRRGLEDGLVVPSWRRPVARIRAEVRAGLKIRRLEAALLLFKHEYGRYRRALGGTAHTLADQRELESTAHPYYNSRAAGGEGHLEVAKNIYYHAQGLCHMVLSLKPFGCMPSTQSDGVQSVVTSHFPDMIYLPVETSGEGEINAHSRVQMALGEARAKARAEFERALAQVGYPLSQIREYVAGHPELQRGLLDVPHHRGFASVSSNFVLLAGRRMRREGIVPLGRVDRDSPPEPVPHAVAEQVSA